MSRVAAVDCGTNSTRLLVMGEDGSEHTRLMRITRLGQGVDATRKLAPDAVDRTLEVLTDYRAVIDLAEVRSIRLVATSATRDAENGDEFLQAASNIIGAPAELLSGLDEGRLACAGAMLGLSETTHASVVVDIGGGSTELALWRDRDVAATSLDIGCVRVTERFLHHDPPTGAELQGAASFVGAALRDGMDIVPGLDAVSQDGILVGLAGSVTTLAALELGLDEYDPTVTHHSTLTRAAVGRWCDVLANEPASARARRRTIVSGREDVIVGGAVILREVMDALGFDACVVSESDILDGIALSLLGRR